MHINLQDLKTDPPGDARQVRSRNALHSALLALLRSRPFDQLTVREISAQAGIGYATFFRHFASKEALLADLALTPIAELLDDTFELARRVDGLTASRTLCAKVQDKAELWSALVNGGAAEVVRGEFTRQAACAQGDTEGCLADWVPASLGIAHLAGATLRVLGWWLRQDEPQSVDEVASILHRMVVAPLVGERSVATGLTG